MPHNLIEVQVRRRLAHYLERRISLHAFCEWFVPRSWDVQEWGSRALRELVYGIELRLAEYTDGHLTEDGLREQLALLVNV